MAVEPCGKGRVEPNEAGAAGLLTGGGVGDGGDDETG
jgi:hypothetical protein